MITLLARAHLSFQWTNEVGDGKLMTELELEGQQETKIAMQIRGGKRWKSTWRRKTKLPVYLGFDPGFEFDMWLRAG